MDPLKLNFVAITTLDGDVVGEPSILTTAQEFVDLEQQADRATDGMAGVSLLCVEGEEWVQDTHPSLGCSCYYMRPVNSDGQSLGRLYSTSPGKWSVQVGSTWMYFNHIAFAAEALILPGELSLEEQVVQMVQDDKLSTIGQATFQEMFQDFRPERELPFQDFRPEREWRYD